MKQATFRPTQAKGRCLETHPALDIGGHLIYGGSCHDPMVTNADIYVALDGYTSHEHRQPWHGVQSVNFKITDMQAPSNPKEFDLMVNWLAMQLTANKLIHIGCIGGHGRTGTVLAALTKVVTGKDDAIHYVREHYCKKAVESKEQVEFLHKHFGIVKAEPTKTYGKASQQPWQTQHYFNEPRQVVPLSSKPLRASPIKSNKSIWGDSVSFDKAQYLL